MQVPDFLYSEAKRLAAENEMGFTEVVRRGLEMLVGFYPRDDGWRLAAAPGFAFRRIVDVRLGLTLGHAGLADFATANLRHFLGCLWVFDPLA